MNGLGGLSGASGYSNLLEGTSSGSWRGFSRGFLLETVGGSVGEAVEGFVGEDVEVTVHCDPGIRVGVVALGSSMVFCWTIVCGCNWIVTLSWQSS